MDSNTKSNTVLLDDEIKKDDMDGIRSTHGVYEKCMGNSSTKT